MSEVKPKKTMKEEVEDNSSEKKVLLVVIISLALVIGLIFTSKYLFKSNSEEKNNENDTKETIEKKLDAEEEEEVIEKNEEEEIIENKPDVVAEAKYYYISITDNLGNNLLSRVKRNLDPADFELPDSPTKEGYRFDKYDVFWNSSKTEVKLIARFIKVWNVNIYDGNDILKTITIDDDTSIPLTEKGSLSKSGHSLIGIYNDPELTTEYANSKITSDTNIYTRWLINPTISNEAYVGTTYPSITQTGLVVSQNNFNINLSGKVSYADSSELSGWGFTEDTHILPLFINAPSEENIIWESKTFNGATELVSVDGTADEEYILGINGTPSGAPHNLVVTYTSTDGKSFTYTYTFDITNLELLPEVGSSYNINYILDNQENVTGVTQLNALTYNYGTELVLSDATTPTLGYVFVGWYSDSNYTNKVTKISDSEYGDKTLYSRFEYSYNISYLGVEDAVNTNITTYTADKGQVTLTTPTRTGYKFMGWKTNDENGDDITNITPQKALDYSVDGTIKLQAIWEIIEYTIKYNLNLPVNTTNPDDITTPPDEIVDVTDEEIILPEHNTPIIVEEVKSYELSGWKKDEASPTITEYTLDVTDANEDNEIELIGVWTEMNLD